MLFLLYIRNNKVVDCIYCGDKEDRWSGQQGRTPMDRLSVEVIMSSLQNNIAWLKASRTIAK